MLLESNVNFIVDRFRLFHEIIFFHRRISISSSNCLLVVARSISIYFTLTIRIVYRYLSWSIRVDFMFENFHIWYSTRFIDWSFDITRRTRSRFSTITYHHSKFSFTIAHRHSTLSSRLFIASRNISHDRSLSFETFIYDYSTLFTSARYQLKLWKMNLSKLA